MSCRTPSSPSRQVPPCVLRSAPAAPERSPWRRSGGESGPPPPQSHRDMHGRAHRIEVAVVQGPRRLARQPSTST
eukprot:1777944-Pyramimonas_sp.AAC.1